MLSATIEEGGGGLVTHSKLSIHSTKLLLFAAGNKRGPLRAINIKMPSADSQQEISTESNKNMDQLVTMCALWRWFIGGAFWQFYFSTTYVSCAILFKKKKKTISEQEIFTQSWCSRKIGDNVKTCQQQAKHGRPPETTISLSKSSHFTPKKNLMLYNP